METKDHVIEDAMRLSAAERLEVAERLYESVEGEAWAQEAWAEEIAQRVSTIDSGEGKMMNWEEARKRIVD